MESCIGLAVTTAVEPMPVGLTGGSRYRVYPAQRGEGRLGVEALGVNSEIASTLRRFRTSDTCRA